MTVRRVTSAKGWGEVRTEYRQKIEHKYKLLPVEAFLKKLNFIYTCKDEE